MTITRSQSPIDGFQSVTVSNDHRSFSLQSFQPYAEQPERVRLTIYGHGVEVSETFKRAEVLESLTPPEPIAELKAAAASLESALNAPGYPADAYEASANAHQAILSILKEFGQ